jgi:hypothetical protein
LFGWNTRYVPIHRSIELHQFQCSFQCSLPPGKGPPPPKNIETLADPERDPQRTPIRAQTYKPKVEYSHADQREFIEICCSNHLSSPAAAPERSYLRNSGIMRCRNPPASGARPNSAPLTRHQPHLTRYQPLLTGHQPLSTRPQPL